MMPAAILLLRLTLPGVPYGNGKQIRFLFLECMKVFKVAAAQAIVNHN